MIETMQISSVSCPECGASTAGLTPLFHHPFCPRLFKAGTDADLIAKLRAENSALREALREFYNYSNKVSSPPSDAMNSRARALLAEKP
jgi:hypothetical protein